MKKITKKPIKTVFDFDDIVDDINAMLCACNAEQIAAIYNNLLNKTNNREEKALRIKAEGNELYETPYWVRDNNG